MLVVFIVTLWDTYSNFFKNYADGRSYLGKGNGKPPKNPIKGSLYPDYVTAFG